MPLPHAHPLSTHVPALSRTGDHGDGPPRSTPHIVPTFCTVLFADLSGFTARSEELSELPDGPEQIGRELNAHLRPLVEIIESHGGDVVKFAGDALLVCWTVDEAHDGLRTSILRAGRCALAMQAAIRSLRRDAPVRTMRLRIGVATGPVRVIHLGSRDARRVLLVTGDGIERATRAGGEANPGEIKLGRLAHQLVSEEVRTEDDGQRPILLDVQPFEELPPPPAVNRSWDPRFIAYLPRTLVHRKLDKTGRWLTETRVVTAMFVHLGDLSTGSDPQRLNQVFETAHHHLSAHGGVTNKLSVDDKGATLLAVFGLPPVVHEDDASRACQAALAVHGALQRLGEQPSIGLATGRAFCGEVGGQSRREYTVIGDTVNTSARLMQLAQGSIFCEEATARRAQLNLRFEALPPVHLKGKSAPIPIFRPVALLEVQARSCTGHRLFGRSALLETFRSAMVEATTGQARVICGEAGVGKSALMQALARSAREQGVAVLRTSGEALHRTRPGHPLRRLLRSLYGTGQSAREAQGVRDALLDAAGEHAELLSAIEDLLPVPFGPRGSQATAPERPRLAELLSRLCRSPLQDRRTLVMVDDGQWLDPLTIDVLRLLAARSEPILVLVATRPPPDADPSTWSALTTFASPETIPQLDRGLTEALLTHRLGKQPAPAHLVAEVHARSGGNPLFIHQLFEHLLATRAVQVSPTGVELSPDELEVWRNQLPAPLEGLLLSRVDQLSARAQFTLKVASILGSRFSRRSLVDLHPLIDHDAQLDDDLHELAALAILAPDEATRSPTSWQFQHTLIREAVYEILPGVQRRRLHATAAAQLMQQPGVDWLGVAHHYAAARDEDRAFDACAHAAARAAELRRPEACRDAVEAAAAHRPLFPASSVHTASLAFAQAVVHWSEGELTTARALLQQVLEALPTRAPCVAGSPGTLRSASVHLLAARVALESGHSSDALMAVESVRQDPTARPEELGVAAALTAHAHWQVGSVRAAQAGLVAPSTADCWTVRTERALLGAASTSSDSLRAGHLSDLDALLQAPSEPTKTSLSPFVAGRLGLALATGSLHEVDAILSRANEAWRLPLTTLHRALSGLPLPPAAPEEAAPRDSSIALSATHTVAQALRAHHAADRAGALSQLIHASTCISPMGLPPPELWPALLAAGRLSLELAETDALPHGLIDRIARPLARAAAACPPLRAATRSLRAELADARGQKLRAWWMRVGGDAVYLAVLNVLPASRHARPVAA